MPGNTSNPFYDPVISATPEMFESQLQYLSRRCHILKLDTLLNIAAHGGMSEVTSAGAKKPLALITLDDGYSDNYATALPILVRLGLPATFFIQTGLFDSAHLPWWDYVAYVIKRTQVSQLELQRWPGDAEPIILNLGFSLGSQLRSAAIAVLVRLLLNNEIKDEPWFLRQLAERAKVFVDVEALGRELFMDLDQVRQLVDAGMSVGSHGQSHQALAGLDEVAQHHELSESKRFLEQLLDLQIKTVAYPFGWSGTYTTQTMQLAREVGYQLAFSSLEGVNYPGNVEFQPFAVHRLNVGTGDSPSLLRARVVFHSALGKSFL